MLASRESSLARSQDVAVWRKEVVQGNANTIQIPTGNDQWGQVYSFSFKNPVLGPKVLACRTFQSTLEIFEASLASNTTPVSGVRYSFGDNRVGPIAFSDVVNSGDTAIGDGVVACLWVVVGPTLYRISLRKDAGSTVIHYPSHDIVRQQGNTYQHDSGRAISVLHAATGEGITAALGCRDGSCLSIQFPPPSGPQHGTSPFVVCDLKQTGVARLVSGLIPGLSNSDGGIAEVLSLSIDGSTYIVALHSSGVLRLWACTDQSMLFQERVCPSDADLVSLRLTAMETLGTADTHNPRFVVHVETGTESQFLVYSLAFRQGGDSEHPQLSVLPAIQAPEGCTRLIDTKTSDRLWALFESDSSTGYTLASTSLLERLPQRNDDVSTFLLVPSWITVPTILHNHHKDRARETTYIQLMAQSRLARQEEEDVEGVARETDRITETIAGFLFHPRRFPGDIIWKALGSVIPAAESDPASSTHLYTSHITPALVSDVRSIIGQHAEAYASMNEGMSADPRAYELGLWERVLQRAWDLELQAQSPWSIALHGESGCVFTVASSAVNMIRPARASEAIHCALGNVTSTPDDIAEYLVKDDEGHSVLMSDDLRPVALLVQCARFVAARCGRAAVQLELEIESGLDPSESVAVHIDSVLAGAVTDADLGMPSADGTSSDNSTRSFPLLFAHKFQSIRNPLTVIEELLEHLAGSDIHSPVAVPSELTSSLAAFVKAPLVRGIIVNSAMQLLDTRFAILRDLLFLLQYLIIRREPITGSLVPGMATGDPAAFYRHVRCTLIPRTSALLRVYYLLITTPRNAVLTAHSSSPLALMARLDLGLQGLGADKGEDGNYKGQQESLLDLFYVDQSQALVSAVTTSPVTDAIPDSVSSSQAAVTTIALDIIDTIMQSFLNELHWVPPTSGVRPMSRAAFFASFLVLQGQATHVERYIRLLDEKSFALVYVLGECFIELSRYEDAENAFLQAAGGIDCKDDTSLLELLRHRDSDLLSSPGGTPGALISYYLHIISIFDRYQLSDHVLSIAYAALPCISDTGNGETSEQQQAAAVLWSIVFKHALALQRFDDAYQALISNPDTTRRADALRRFVIVVTERNSSDSTDLLCRLPFVGMIQDVMSVLRNKARTSEVTSVPNYYQLLYALQIQRSNFRDAAATMYELGERYTAEGELVSPTLLRHQVHAYLAALMALELEQPDLRCFVRPRCLDPAFGPSSTDDSTMGGHHSTMSVMGTGDSNDVTIIEVSDLKKRHALAAAHLALSTDSPRHKAGVSMWLTPTDTLTLMCEAGLIDGAFTLARAYDLSFEPMFDALSRQCVAAAQARPGDASLERKWQEVRRYLELFDSASTNYKYHQCVAERVLSYDRNIKLPIHILVDTYRRVHPVGLLRVYIKFGHASDAAQLLLYCIKNSKDSVTAESGTCSTYLPYTLVDQVKVLLQRELEASQRNSSQQEKTSELQALSQEVEARLSDYFRFLDNVVRTQTLTVIS